MINLVGIGLRTACRLVIIKPLNSLALMDRVLVAICWRIEGHFSSNI